MSRRSKAFVIGLGTTVIAHGAAAAWIWAVFDQLPAQVVTHWGAQGPDGFTPRDEIWIGLLIGLGIALALGALLVALMPTHGSGLAAAAGITAGLGSFLAATIGGTTILQAGTSASDPLEFQVWWLVPLTLGAVVIGVVSGKLLGPARARPTASRIPARPLRLPEDDARRTWTSQVTASPGFLLILLLPLPAFAVLAIVMQDWLMPLIVTALIALPLLAMWRWQLQVDDSGLTTRSFVGWPTLRHSLDEIEIAEALRRVESMEYGGPGLRLTRQGERLALRSGPALRLMLSDGTDFIATTPDADTAARTLNTLIAERRTA